MSRVILPRHGPCWPKVNWTDSLIFLEEMTNKDGSRQLLRFAGRMEWRMNASGMADDFGVAMGQPGLRGAVAWNWPEAL